MIEDPFGGGTYFGSLYVPGVASATEANLFLGRPTKGELGQPSEWPGAYLSSLYAFDLFAANPDRQMVNFFLIREGLVGRLCVFDFASARLPQGNDLSFPVATTATKTVGSFLRHRHGFSVGAANEMIERIASVPTEIIVGILKQMPDDWMSIERKEDVSGLWSERIRGRLLALRAGIADGSLL